MSHPNPGPLPLGGRVFHLYEILQLQQEEIATHPADARDDMTLIGGDCYVVLRTFRNDR